MKYNAYLLHVLQKRSTELKAAYQHIVQLGCHAQRLITNALVQTQLDTDDIAIQTVQSRSVSCDECCALKETVQETKRLLSDSIQSVTDRDCELAQLKRQLCDSVNALAELTARADAEEAARKVKEDEVDELEELVMLCKTESLAAEQQRQLTVDSSSKENESLRSELSAIKASLQNKDEALVQNMLEKDDLEEMNARLQASNTCLLRQVEELQVQMQDHKSQFEGEIQHLADERQQLIEKAQTLNSELTRCSKQAASVPLSSSETVDFLVSQQSSEQSAVKLELLTLQAEKDDLIQQLHECKAELSAQLFNSRQSDQESKNSVTSTSVSTKPPGMTASPGELESQNAALLGQLLVVEDQLLECEMQLQASHDSHQKNVEQLNTALQELSDSSTRVASLERDKRELETELNAAKMNLETCSARLQECETHLSLVEGKLSSAGNRQRQLLTQKQSLESQNHELLQKLQLATLASKQQQHAVIAVSSSSHSTYSEHVRSSRGEMSRVSPANKLTFAAETCQQTGNWQVMRDATTVRIESKCRDRLTTDAENHVPCGMSAAADRQLLPCTTSPAALWDVCDTPTSVHCERTASLRGNTDVCMKRRIMDGTVDTDIGGKRHSFAVSNQQTGLCIIIRA